ncbi:UDP-N-acetylmuramate--L-alanine ligase [Kitasatospora indigofera]|uniref:UDP-N-acetylmuramate--L-alanine ligase n=1 Tax=Kitasatospora indigofera TaxID=67307 RepID=UPI0036B92098
MPEPTFTTPFAGRRLHFVGVGGCGVSGLALIAQKLGAEVTGSDMKSTMYLQSLQANGLTGMRVGHSVEHVPAAPAQIVYSSAIKPDNVERARARELGLPELHRSDLLAEITRVRRTIAVAGAHGKSSTSSLGAHVFSVCGVDPSYVVGALLRPPGVHAATGAGDLLVIEADESDKSLLSYQVDTAVVTNVDLDHVGDAGYQSVQDVAAVLAQFANRARETVVTEQAASYLSPLVANLTVVEPELIEGRPLVFRWAGEEYEVTHPGEHQLRNAALVVYLALREGCSPEAIRAALLSYPGVARRFELRGRTPGGARVVDDYAHHPVEVEAAVSAARQIAGNDGRVLAVFQPHLFSRTQQFLNEFLAALGKADAACMEPVYPAREDPEHWGHVAEQLVAATGRADGVVMSPGREELVRMLRETAGPEDVVLLLGAGDVTELGEPLTA